MDMFDYLTIKNSEIKNKNVSINKIFFLVILSLSISI